MGLMSWTDRTCPTRWGLWSHPWQFEFHQRGRTWWHILPPCSLRLTSSPRSTTICKTVPAYTAGVGFTCPNLGTWKWDTEAQGGHPGLSSCSKSGWLTSLGDQPPRQLTQSGGTCFCTVCVGSFQLSTQVAHSHINFSFLCSLLQTFIHASSIQKIFSS